jgi:hypothetical protein
VLDCWIGQHLSGAMAQPGSPSYHRPSRPISR